MAVDAASHRPTQRDYFLVAQHAVLAVKVRHVLLGLVVVAEVRAVAAAGCTAATAGTTEPHPTSVVILLRA